MPCGSSMTSAFTRRCRNSCRVRRWGSPAMPASSSAPTANSTRVLSGVRRSTVSEVMRAPVIIAKAKKRAPTMSHSAWKLPMPSPMRSNQPSVRMASKETTSGAGILEAWARAPARVHALMRGSTPPRAFSTMEARKIRAKLLAWYDRNGRDLPWRRTRDPYAIWVSEVMLQQTQVKTVLGRYAHFLGRFPSVGALARAREADVLHAWQGLGYYSRARRLHQAARAVHERHAGLIPRSREGLLRLPGVGAYSAGAVASIAFGERVPVVDGNVVRVLTRLFALAGDPGRAPLRARLWDIASELVPDGRPGDFNQALMELGATLCTPRGPASGRCPLARECRARARGTADRLPELPARARTTEVRVAAAL